MRKGEALYTYFMKKLAKRERDKEGNLVLVLDADNAIAVFQGLFDIPDEDFDKIIAEETSL